MAFRGTYEHSLDAKNRLTIPSKFRDQLSGKLVVAQAIKPCVAIMTEEAFDNFTNSFLKDLNPLSEEAERLSHYFNAGSFDGELDKAGRVMVAPPLISYAELGKDVAVIGNGDRLEIWDQTKWSEYQADLTTNLAQTVANIVNAA
jgi:MraZ protein